MGQACKALLQHHVFCMVKVREHEVAVSRVLVGVNLMGTHIQGDILELKWGECLGEGVTMLTQVKKEEEGKVLGEGPDHNVQGGSDCNSAWWPTHAGDAGWAVELV